MKFKIALVLALLFSILPFAFAQDFVVGDTGQPTYVQDSQTIATQLGLIKAEQSQQKALLVKIQASCDKTIKSDDIHTIMNEFFIQGKVILKDYLGQILALLLAFSIFVYAVFALGKAKRWW